MTDTTILLSPRTVTGNNVRKLRTTGVIPAVVYGPGASTVVNYQIDAIAFEKAFRSLTLGDTTTIDIDGKSVTAILKDVDMDPRKDIPRHVDFYLP